MIKKNIVINNSLIQQFNSSLEISDKTEFLIISRCGEISISSSTQTVDRVDLHNRNSECFGKAHHEFA